MKAWGFITLALAMFIGGVSLAVAQDKKITGNMTRAQVERIIEEYLDKNGGKVAASIEKHMVAERMQQTRNMLAAHTPTLGPKDAKVVMIEFSDFDCPFCRRVQPTLDELRRRYKGRILFAYKHLPLAIHPKARDAAHAAQAAHKQGKFWEFTSELWNRQEFSGERLWEEVADEVGLDMDQFNKDRASDEIKRQVEEDEIHARMVGGRGTPYFTINGIPLSGAQPLDNFVEIIEAVLNDQGSALVR